MRDGPVSIIRTIWLGAASKTGATTSRRNRQAHIQGDRQMKMRQLILYSTLCALCFGVPKAALSEGPIGGDVTKVVTDLDHQWLEHARTHKTQFLLTLFTDDFVEILDGGQILTKAQLIGSLAANNTQMTHLDADDIQVSQVTTNLVVLTDRTTIKGLLNGKDITAQYRVFRVFIKQDGKWRAAGASLTRLASNAK
jgi:ketosteroid isomerase-like protein